MSIWVLLIWSLQANLQCFSTNCVHINGSYYSFKKSYCCCLTAFVFLYHDAKTHFVSSCHIAYFPLNHIEILCGMMWNTNTDTCPDRTSHGIHTGHLCYAGTWQWGVQPINSSLIWENLGVESKTKNSSLHLTHRENISSSNIGGEWWDHFLIFCHLFVTKTRMYLYLKHTKNKKRLECDCKFT